MTNGSKNRNKEKPNSAPPKEIVTNHLLIGGIFEKDLFLLGGKHFVMISKENPTGHKYLQNHRDLNQENTRMINPIR